VDVEEVVRYWWTSAEEDWPVAEHLYDSGDYHYALFLAHLCLEKQLKALVVKVTGEHAPRTHSLLLLAERGGLSLSEDRHDALLRFTGYNIAARYPDDISSARAQYSPDFTRGELHAAKEIGKWLKSVLSRPER
jgi:HEPN domain-containing protein